MAGVLNGVVSRDLMASLISGRGPDWKTISCDALSLTTEHLADVKYFSSFNLLDNHITSIRRTD